MTKSTGNGPAGILMLAAAPTDQTRSRLLVLVTDNLKDRIQPYDTAICCASLRLT